MTNLEHLKSAKALSRIPVISVDGTKIGNLDNLSFDPSSGNLTELLVEPTTTLKLELPTTKDGRFIIPSVAVKAIKDVVLVDLNVTR